MAYDIYPPPTLKLPLHSALALPYHVDRGTKHSQCRFPGTAPSFTPAVPSHGRVCGRTSDPPRQLSARAARPPERQAPGMSVSGLDLDLNAKQGTHTLPSSPNTSERTQGIILTQHVNFPGDTSNLCRLEVSVQVGSRPVCSVQGFWQNWRYATRESGRLSLCLCQMTESHRLYSN